ncbi:AtzH-like domain-containing protein [Gordonia sp. DT219]|uniref:AtzH-like domain-containing protein n=1 Tax=Gordonia sp. DT219 TaxID=3416658 RepID=UPI003CF5B0AE
MSADVPDGLLAAFYRYENAFVTNDLVALDELFQSSPDTLRGDNGGLLVGHGEISAFRRARGGRPVRTLDDVHVRVLDRQTALIVAVTAPARGGHGLQTQLWRRSDTGWAVAAAHTTEPPATFDSSVWRVVGDPLIAPLSVGPLSGESVAVKDLFAVKGFSVGAGVPEYLQEQEPQSAHAESLRRLLAAGASVRGIARTDQFAYSIDGINPHYGTPVNPNAPGCLPGGSSSGCATAVALGNATIGLATDTAGSIRVPAGYQGLWGLRTTHGSVPTTGVLPLAPSFDTVGLLTKGPQLLSVAATELLGGSNPLKVADDPIMWDDVADEFAWIDECYGAFRVVQAYEAWLTHGAWIEQHPDALRGDVRSRFDAASKVSARERAAASDRLTRFRKSIDARLGDAVVIMPTTAGAIPRLWDSRDQLEQNRRDTLRLTCIAGITGRPVVTVPQDPVHPYSRSFVGPRGSDLTLIGYAHRDRRRAEKSAVKVSDGTP